MKAEIGFMWESMAMGEPGAKEPQRLRLTVTAETITEGAMIRVFKRRLGIADSVLDGMYGQLFIEEPMPDILPDSEAR